MVKPRDLGSHPKRGVGACVGVHSEVCKSIIATFRTNGLGITNWGALGPPDLSQSIKRIFLLCRLLCAGVNRVPAGGWRGLLGFWKGWSGAKRLLMDVSGLWRLWGSWIWALFNFSHKKGGPTQP